ncbi:MAG: hypothetical protein EZS28_049794, partial [Streblomastix strix]
LDPFPFVIVVVGIVIGSQSIVSYQIRSISPSPFVCGVHHPPTNPHLHRFTEPPCFLSLSNLLVFPSCYCYCYCYCYYYCCYYYSVFFLATASKSCSSNLDLFNPFPLSTACYFSLSYILLDSFLLDLS